MIFSNALGFQANLDKRNIYFGGVAREENEFIIQQFDIPIEELSFRYLGIPLTTKKLSVL